MTEPHPWYGPCDALGPDGCCAECWKLKEAIVTDRDRQLAHFWMGSPSAAWVRANCPTPEDIEADRQTLAQRFAQARAEERQRCAEVLTRHFFAHPLYRKALDAIENPISPFWISWYADPENGPFELHSPWWISATDPSDIPTVCAALRAHSPQHAQNLVAQAHTNLTQPLIFRFTQQKPPNWSPFSDRFPNAGWMTW